MLSSRQEGLAKKKAVSKAGTQAANATAKKSAAKKTTPKAAAKTGTAAVKKTQPKMKKPAKATSSTDQTTSSAPRGRP